MMERRERNRTELQLDCHVAGESEPARTENISRSGILIRCSDKSAEMRVGEAITIEVSLPRNPLFEQRCLHLRGRIVRVRRADGALLMAAQVAQVAVKRSRKSLPVFRNPEALRVM